MVNVRKEMSVFLDRQTVRRKRNWIKRLRQTERVLISIAIVLLGLAGLYGIYCMVFLGPTFAIHKIVIDGKWNNMTAGGLARLSGVSEGDNLFWLNVEGVYKRLSEDPWVATTAVRRKLPDTLWIYVEEEIPVAIESKGEGLFFLNSDGAAFKKVEAADEKRFPVFTGLDLGRSDDALETNVVRVKDMLKIMDVFAKSAFGNGREVSEVHFDKMRGYSIVTKRDPVQILLGHIAFEDRMAEIDKFYGAIASRPGRIQYILANEPHKVTVRYQTT